MRAAQPSQKIFSYLFPPISQTKVVFLSTWEHSLHPQVPVEATSDISSGLGVQRPHPGLDLASHLPYILNYNIMAISPLTSFHTRKIYLTPAEHEFKQRYSREN